jgi:hypothetical protein
MNRNFKKKGKMLKNERMISKLERHGRKQNRRQSCQSKKRKSKKPNKNCKIKVSVNLNSKRIYKRFFSKR